MVLTAQEPHRCEKKKKKKHPLSQPTTTLPPCVCVLSLSWQIVSLLFCANEENSCNVQNRRFLRRSGHCLLRQRFRIWLLDCGSQPAPRRLRPATRFRLRQSERILRGQHSAPENGRCCGERSDLRSVKNAHPNLSHSYQDQPSCSESRIAYGLLQFTNDFSMRTYIANTVFTSHLELQVRTSDGSIHILEETRGHVSPCTPQPDGCPVREEPLMCPLSSCSRSRCC